MFHLEGIMFIAALCAVNASVTVNIYDDDLEYNKIQNVKSCNYRECDQQCRRIGFPGGACVGDRCKCDIIRNNDLDSTEGQNVKSCNYRECDQQCRRIGFLGGACVGVRCKCDIIRNNDYEENNIEQSLRGCNDDACDQLCRRMGFIGGVCTGDRCQCGNLLPTRVDETHSVNEDENDINYNYKNNEAVDICNPVACEVACLAMGYPGGACSKGKCSCAPKVQVNEMSRSLQYCDVVACNNMCHRMHYIGGMCRLGFCKCY